MWQIIADNLLKGMGAAGWCIGFMALLGLFLIVGGTLVLALSYAFGGPDEDEEDGDE